MVQDNSNKGIEIISAQPDKPFGDQARAVVKLTRKELWENLTDPDLSILRRKSVTRSDEFNKTFDFETVAETGFISVDFSTLVTPQNN